MKDKLAYRSLTEVKELIEDLGFAISYPFDDLVFIDSNAFLIQYNDEVENGIWVRFNSEIDEGAKKDLTQQLIDSPKAKKFKMKIEGSYTLEDSDEEGQFNLRMNE